MASSNSADSVYMVKAIGEKFWSIEESDVRCFLIEGSDRAMLVDTGFGKGDIKAVCESLTSLPIFVVNTHTDHDHTGCNESFTEIYMHPADFSYYRASPKGSTADVRLLPAWEGASFDLSNRSFEVILIPGHTPGSIALLDRKNRIIITGDSIQQNRPIYMFGQGRNMEAYLLSLQKLQSMAHLFDTILPSHGETPIKPDLIGTLIEAAKVIISGKAQGVSLGGSAVHKLYDFGIAKFYHK